MEPEDHLFLCIYFSVFITGCVSPVSHTRYQKAPVILSGWSLQYGLQAFRAGGPHSMPRSTLRAELSPRLPVALKGHAQAWLCTCTYIWTTAFPLAFCSLPVKWAHKHTPTCMEYLTDSGQ